MIGKQIQQFKIVEKLGAGGMGEVYTAEDTRLHRKVALKFLPPQYSSDAEFKSRFEHEATAAAALNHPNIITVYELGEHEGRLFIALELVEGQSLEQMIESGDVKLSTALKIGVQMCEGLGAAHQAGIVHRDIKPANILVDRSGRVKILDFGLAKSRRATTETKVGTTVGTIQYESPEQGRGDTVDQRSDLFSLGVVLYELITGQRPFGGEFTDAIRYAIANDNPEPLARYKSDVPDDLQRIIFKLLEKDPDLRYQTATGLLSDLKLLLRSSGPTPSSVHSAVNPATRPRKSPRRFVVPAAIVVVAVALLLVFKPWSVVIQPTSEATAGDDRIAVMYFENLGDREDARRLGEIVANLLISDLSESKYMQVVSSQRLYDLLKQLGREGTRTIPPDVATQVARKARAKYMVTGSIMQAEPSFVVSAQLVEVEGGQVLASPTIEGSVGESVYRVVDRLTDGIKGSMALPAEALAEQRSERQEPETGSTEAYRLFLEGQELGMNFRWAEAEEKFTEALTHDSTFAMAHWGISKSRELWWGDWDGARRAAARAVAHIDRANDHDRHLILAREAILDNRAAEAVGHLEGLLARYPDDKEAYYSLGRIYQYNPVLRDYPRAVEMYEKVVELDPQHKDAYNRMAYAYDRIGDLERSLWAINKYIEMAPNEANPYDSRGDLYAANGQPDPALASYRKAIEANPNFLWSVFKAAGIMMLREDYAGAEKLLEPVVTSDDPETRCLGREEQVKIALHRGRIADYLRRVDEAIKTQRNEVGTDSRLADFELRKAFAHAQRRDFEAAMQSVFRARDLLDQIDTTGASEGSTWGSEALVHSKFGHAREADSLVQLIGSRIGTPSWPDSLGYYWTRSRVDLNLGRYDSVVTWVQRALGPDPPLFEALVLMGRGHMGARRLRDAVETFERAERDYGRGRQQTPAMDVKLHYWLAQAYEKSGRASEAIEEYREFLRIWRDADDGIPEVADARTRLAELGA